MVSFWPFKVCATQSWLVLSSTKRRQGQDTSAASFEKLLSSLSTKINKETAKNDSLRQRHRRYRALWTLYSIFAYILAAIILTLVTGWQNWTAVEYTGLAGAPVLIYGVRTALDAFFNYRVAGSQNYLNDLTKQRETAITKLKEATKYNSTQQLLEKYGGSPAKPSTPSPGNRRVSSGPNKPPAPRVNRTGIAPPPTANIPSRQQPQQLPGSPQNPLPPQQPSSFPSSLHPPQNSVDDSADFAPNAFSAPSRPPTEYASSGPRWFDRILDVVLGDDETQPKNRIVLICKSCRLVNGQAPPGTRSMEDMGPWRCMSCQTMNGQESEAKEMIQKIVGGDDVKEGVKRRQTTLDGADEDTVSADSLSADEQVSPDVEDGADEDELENTPPSASTRSKAKQPNKK